MHNNRPNPSIKCSVHSCKYHFQKDNYCSLDVIQVGTHEEHPKVKQCTDCMSFESL